MRGFIEKLGHRNVSRVGVGYVVMGWLIVQLADVAVKGVGSSFFRAKAALLAICNRLSLPADSSSAPRHDKNPNYAALGALGGVSTVVFAAILFEPWQNLYLTQEHLPSRSL